MTFLDQRYVSCALTVLTESNRTQQCAFVEFNDPSAYTAAVAANPHTVNDEVINVEERRPRPGAAGNFGGNFPRGGASAPRGRGGLPQRSGSQGASRRNFQGQRGGKPAGPARGRGQSQAA